MQLAFFEVSSIKYKQGTRSKNQTTNQSCLFCGPSEADDLAAQIVADLCEADGWEVRFGGGGVPADEILAETNEYKPDAFVCSHPPHAMHHTFETLLTQLKQSVLHHTRK